MTRTQILRAAAVCLARAIQARRAYRDEADSRLRARPGTVWRTIRADAAAIASHVRYSQPAGARDATAAIAASTWWRPVSVSG